MKKILFFINTLGTGGAEHVLVDIANSLDKNKFDITIKTIYDINVYEDSINSNIKVESFYHTKKNKFIDKIYRKILYLKIMHYKKEKLYKMFIKDNYDIEVAFLEGLPTKVIAGSSNKQSKKIAWIHTDFKTNKEASLFFKSFDDEIGTYKKYTEIYCVSDESKKSFCDIYNIKNNVFAIYNIINKEKVKRNSKDKCLLNNTFNIITVGRLVVQKGHLRLLNAYSNVLNKLNINTHLYIVGDGPERALVESEIKKLDLVTNVTLLGNQENPYKYMANSNLYVCSSLTEGYSLVILEALTVGIPVLTTRCAGVAHILNDGEFGLIVDNSTEGLEKGLIELINNPQKLNEYKENIKKNYSKYEFSVDKIEKQILK